MANPFYPKIAVLNHIKASDSITNYTFETIVTDLCIEPSWKLIKKSENFLFFDYVSSPQLNEFTICMYDGDGQFSLVFHSHSEMDALTQLASFVQSI